MSQEISDFQREIRALCPLSGETIRELGNAKNMVDYFSLHYQHDKSVKAVLAWAIKNLIRHQLIASLAIWN